MSCPSSATLSPSDQLQMNVIEKLQVFKIQGRDKHGRKVLRIIGKYFPGKLIDQLPVCFSFSLPFRFCNLIISFIIISISSKCEQRGSEQLLEGENLPKVGGQAVFNCIRAHRCSAQRKLPRNFYPPINLRGYSDQHQGISRSCLLCPPRFAGQTLPSHLWSSPFHRRVSVKLICFDACLAFYVTDTL